MPVYNGEPYLTAALESILAQTFADFVLVVSDNASTDATEEIVRSFQQTDKRIEYFRGEENHGAAWNYNRVFAACRSPLFRWAASDDLLAPTNVERCLQTLEEALPHRVVLVCPQTHWVDAEGRFLHEGDDRMDVRYATPHQRLGHVVRNVLWGSPLFGLIDAQALRRTRGHGNFPSADWVLMAELALQGELWTVPEPLFFRREHLGSSRTANATPHEVAQWLDPQNVKPENELKRVFFEYMRGIKHAQLSHAERSLCYTTTAVTFTRRHAAVRGRIAVRTRLRNALHGGGLRRSPLQR
jgi:glycosyltransferase involved in cell wall biosynthesis